MRMRLFTINSNVSIDQPADAKTHTLGFRPVISGMAASIATSSLTLALTQEQASQYTLGAMYDVTAILAENQTPMRDEGSMESPQL